jgi:hypothetical protein
MRVYASSITEEQRIASGGASVAGTDREGFDEVKGQPFQYVPVSCAKLSSRLREPLYLAGR